MHEKPGFLVVYRQDLPQLISRLPEALERSVAKRY